MISMLVIQSIWDCLYKKIPICVTVAGGALGILVSVLDKRAPMDFVVGILPGIFCLLIGWITREAIGYGDGFLLCAMGTYLSFGEIMEIAMWASVLAGVVGLVLMVVCKKRGKEEIPFVPFLLLGTAIYYISERGIYI